MADQSQWQPPSVPDYFGTNDTVQSWLDENLANYLEQNPGAFPAARLLGAVPGLVPTGTVLDFAGSTAPDGYVFCDGTTYDGTSGTYLNLWAVIGVTYGGSGQSAFKVPDTLGRYTVGKGSNADVNALNNSDGLVNASRTPKSSLSISGTTGSESSHTHSVTIAATTPETASGVTNVAPGQSVTSGPGSSHSHSFSGSGSTAPGFVVLNKIIKL